MRRNKRQSNSRWASGTIKRAKAQATATIGNSDESQNAQRAQPADEMVETPEGLGQPLTNNSSSLESAPTGFGGYQEKQRLSNTRDKMDHDPFDDSSFHESVIGDTSEASDAYPAARSSTASLIPNSPGFEHGYVNCGIPGLRILVFDVQKAANSSSVHGKIYTTTSCDNLLTIVAEMCSVSEECVVIDLQNMPRIAVIADPVLQKENLFLVTSELSGSQYCVSVRKTMTVATFINTVGKNRRKEHEEMLYLILKGRIYKSSTQELCQIVGPSHLIEFKFMKQLQLKVKCHYHHTPGIEILYHLVCFNTDTVEELKMKFIRQFGNEFPSNLDKSVEVNFSYHTRVLTNDGYFLLDGEPGRSEPGLSVARLGDLTIHVTSKDNRPVCVTFTESGKRTVKKVIVTEKSATTEDLRLVIGNQFKQEPNSLKLRLNLKKKKIPDDMVLEKIDGFLPNCHIFAEASDKTTFKIKISREGKSSTRIVEMYKYDKVSQLRDLLATSEKTNVFSVQLCYSGKEMDDDKRLKIYHIGQEDIIKMEIFNNRIEVRIRCLGMPPVKVVINNACETTVLDLKSCLSTKIGIAVSEINVIFDATSLNNGDTLVDAGIHSSNIVIVRRFSPPERKYVGGIFPLYHVDELGVVQKIRKVLIHCGRLLFLEDDEKMDTLSDNIQQNDPAETGPKGIRLVKDQQNEEISNQRQDEQTGMKPGNQFTNSYTSSSTEDKELVPPETSPTYTARNLNKADTTNISSNTWPKNGSRHSENQIPVRSTLITENAQTNISTSSTMFPNSSIPPTAVAWQSVYQSKVLKYRDGNIMETESHVYHTSMSSEDLAQMSGSVSDDSYFRTGPKGSSSCILSRNKDRREISLQEEPLKDELTRRFRDIADKLGSEWQRLALNLGLVKKDIDQFMNEHPRHLMLQAYTMLSFWYEKEGKSASKDALVRGLQESELNSIAELLEV